MLHHLLDIHLDYRTAPSTLVATDMLSEAAGFFLSGRNHIAFRLLMVHTPRTINPQIIVG